MKNFAWTITDDCGYDDDPVAIGTRTNPFPGSDMCAVGVVGPHESTYWNKRHLSGQRRHTHILESWNRPESVAASRGEAVMFQMFTGGKGLIQGAKVCRTVRYRGLMVFNGCPCVTGLEPLEHFGAIVGCTSIMYLFNMDNIYKQYSDYSALPSTSTVLAEVSRLLEAKTPPRRRAGVEPATLGTAVLVDKTTVVCPLESVLSVEIIPNVSAESWDAWILDQAFELGIKHAPQV